MTRELTIKDHGKDYGYNRYNARDGNGSLVISTNSIRELVWTVEDFFANPEPDYEDEAEEKQQPTYREKAIMEHGNAHVREPFEGILNGWFKG